MIQERNSQRATRGFTMTEMLASVAILAIIASIAFLAFGDVQKNLKMNELDNSAKQVYMAAQSRITDLQAAGKLASLSGEIKALNQGIATQPQDYPDSNWNEVSAYYVVKGQAAVDDWLITDDSSVLTKVLNDGDYLIELSPSTAEIYSVFYVESGNTITYADVTNLASRSRDDRTADRIGYYGGGKLSAAAEDPERLKELQCDFVNDQELYLKLYGADFAKLAANVSQLSITVSLTGEDASGKPLKAVKSYSGTEIPLVAGDSEIDLVFDSLESGRSLKDWLADAGVTTMVPGCDVTASVSVTYKGITYDAHNTHLQDQTTNSLFSNLDTATHTVTVKTLRQLNNLRSSVLGNEVEAVNKIDTVNIAADIDFATQASSGTKFAPLDGFVLGAGKTINGKDAAGTIHTLSNFQMEGGSNVGLLSTLSGSVSNLIIRDAAVSATGSNVGILAGNISGDSASVSNVKIVNSTVATPGDNVGGLAGNVTGGTFSGCGVYKEYGASPGSVSGGKNVGGFIGVALSNKKIDVSYSFAALPAAGKASIGGFVGRATATSANDLKMNHCYASGSVTASESHYDGSTTAIADPLVNGEGAGGFAGTLPSSSGKFTTINNCFATGDVTGPECLGGFIGYLYSGWIGQSSVSDEVGGCQSFGLVKPTEPLNWTDGGFVGAKRSGNPARNADCYYLSMNNANAGFDENGKSANSGGAWSVRLPSECKKDYVLPTERTHVFSSNLEDRLFLYQEADWFNGPDGQINTDDDLDFYGDWTTWIVANIYDNDSGKLAASVEALPLWQGGTQIVFPTPKVPKEDPGTTNIWKWNGLLPVVEHGSDDDPAVFHEDMTFIGVPREEAEKEALSNANTALHSWVAEPTVAGSDGKAKSTGTINSEAVGSNIRGTAIQFNEYLTSCGYDPASFSWCLSFTQGTVLSPGSSQGLPLLGSGENIHGGLVMYLGEKAETAGDVVDVTCYDVGRANSEPSLLAVCEGTLKVKTKDGYLIYDPSTFTPSSTPTDWHN